ncbi:hypothetical protein CA265_08280 [Sphingobacteriaceae bacterium GW460-11-11-14-LB5]|nr:hypothetical protein CA265_08280 [Sphingobacteriaceae bacterium GW460-11-11-14-LB5]
MALNNKQFYQLVAFSSRQWPFLQPILPILDQAEIDASKIDLTGPASTMWFNIIKRADSLNQLMKLLEVMVIKIPNNDHLKEIKADLAGASFTAQVEHLKTEIRNGHCVLFLGPHFLKYSVGNENIPFSDLFMNELIESLEKYDISYDKTETDNLSYLIDRFETRDLFVSGDTERKAKKISEENDLNSGTFNRIRQLNFPLIINTNPDTTLENLFPAYYSTGFYDMSNSQSPPPVDNGKPFVYNIFGSFENPASIIFTEKEAVDFTKNIYQKNPPIPEFIREIIRNRYGIFIGFDFKEWHLKILFNVLDLRNKPGNYAFTEMKSALLERNMEYYRRQYNMSFVKNDVYRLLVALQ